MTDTTTAPDAKPKGKPTHCPECRADFDGGAIPLNMRTHYSPPYRWSRIIGISSMEHDMLVAWECPDCGHRFPIIGRETLFPGNTVKGKR